MCFWSCATAWHRAGRSRHLWLPLHLPLGRDALDRRVVMTARLDIRYPIIVEEEGEGVTCGRMCMALSGTPFSVQRLGGHGVLHVPAEHKVVKGLLEVYHDMTGLDAYPIAIGGGTYSRTMPNTVAFGPCFPGDPDPCHMPDEYIEVEKYMMSIRIMAHAIETLAGK